MRITHNDNFVYLWNDINDILIEQFAVNGIFINEENIKENTVVIECLASAFS